MSHKVHTHPPEEVRAQVDNKRCGVCHTRQRLTTCGGCMSEVLVPVGQFSNNISVPGQVESTMPTLPKHSNDRAGIADLPAAKQPNSTCPARGSFVKGSSKDGGRLANNLVAFEAPQLNAEAKREQSATRGGDEFLWFQDLRSWRDV
jgi:hypothetical protein